MKQRLSKRKLLLGLFFFVLLAFSPFKIFALAAVILGLAHILPLKINFFSRIVVAYLLFFAVNTLVAGAGYLLDIALPVEVLFAALLGLVAWLFHLSDRSGELNIFQLTRSAIVSVLLFTGLLALLALPSLRGDNHSVVRGVTFGGDNTSHLELINAVRERGGYFYEKPSLTGTAITENLASYPQGLHFNVYVLMETVEPLIDLNASYKRLLSFYYLYTLVLFLLFGWLLIIAIQTTTVASTWGATVSAIAVSAILFSGLFYSLFALGFQTQIASSALFLGMLIFLQRMFVSVSIGDKKRYAVLALCMLAGISFTWLFPLPIAVIIFAVCFALQFTNHVSKNFSKNLPFLGSCLALGIMALIQPVIQMLNHTSRTAGVNEIGYTVRPSTLIVIALVSVALGVTLILFQKVKVLWTASLGSAILFSLFIYVFQWSRVGEARYYYYKSLFILILVAVIPLAAAMGKMIDLAVQRTNFRGYILSCFLVAACALSAYNLTNPTDFFKQQQGGGFSPELAATVMDLIEDNPTNGRKIIAVGSCNRAYDYTASRLVAVLTNEYDLARQGLVSAELNPDRLSLLQAIRYYQKVKSPELIIVSGDYPLQKYLQRSLDDGYGHETYIDLDFGHVPKTVAACPHLVR